MRFRAIYRGKRRYGRNCKRRRGDGGSKRLVCAAKLPDIKGAFYAIRWKTDTEEGLNHFVCNIGEGWMYEAYKACMEKLGFYDEFEGF